MTDRDSLAHSNRASGSGSGGGMAEFLSTF